MTPERSGAGGGSAGQNVTGRRSFWTFGQAERAGAREDLKTYCSLMQTTNGRLSGGLRMRIFPILVVGIAISLAGCGRDPGPKGDTGPQGPAGPQGVQG